MAGEQPRLEMLVLVRAVALGAIEAVHGVVDRKGASLVVPANEVFLVDVAAVAGVDPAGHVSSRYGRKIARASSASSSFSCSFGSIGTEVAASG